MEGCNSGGGVLLVTDFHLQGIVGFYVTDFHLQGIVAFYASVSVDREELMVSSLAQCCAISM